MVSVKVEGVRRTFGTSSVFMYVAMLFDEPNRRVFMFGIERHEALPIVATLHKLPSPRPQTINLMVDTLTSLGQKLEKVHLENYSMLPPRYNLCSCRLRWRKQDGVQEQVLDMRPGDMIALALLMKAPLSIANEIASQIAVPLAGPETPELMFARYLLRQEDIPLPAGLDLRLDFGKTPLRDALVKEFKAALQGKAPPFPEEDVEQRKKEYLAFILGEEAPLS